MCVYMYVCMAPLTSPIQCLDSMSVKHRKGAYHQ